MKKLIILSLVGLSLSACQTVEPWECGNLAKDHMAFEPDSLQRSFQEHMRFSKEASSGGYGTGGGGCGCN